VRVSPPYIYYILILAIFIAGASLGRSNSDHKDKHREYRELISYRGIDVIVLAEPKAVRKGGLRLIRDRGETLITHVISGGSHSLAGR